MQVFHSARMGSLTQLVHQIHNIIDSYSHSTYINVEDHNIGGSFVTLHEKDPPKK